MVHVHIVVRDNQLRFAARRHDGTGSGQSTGTDRPTGLATVYRYSQEQFQTYRNLPRCHVLSWTGIPPGRRTGNLPVHSRGIRLACVLELLLLRRLVAGDVFHLFRPIGYGAGCRSKRTSLQSARGFPWIGPNDGLRGAFRTLGDRNRVTIPDPFDNGDSCRPTGRNTQLGRFHQSARHGSGNDLVPRHVDGQSVQCGHRSPGDTRSDRRQKCSRAFSGCSRPTGPSSTVPSWYCS